MSSSYRFPYSIPQDSGYKNVAPGQGSLAYISIFGGMAIGALLCAPLIALTIWLHLSGASRVAVGRCCRRRPLTGSAHARSALKGIAPRVAGRLPEILTAVSRG